MTGGGVEMDLREALVICRRRNVPIEALGTFFGPKGKPVVRDLQADRVFPDFTFGTHLCDVEVDLDTGKVRVLRYVAAHDVGRAINPLSVRGPDQRRRRARGSGWPCSRRSSWTTG